MKIALSWLQEFFHFRLELHDVARRLTSLGLEVDNIEVPKHRFSGVVIGKIIATTPHPNADRLTVATVFDGKEELQIVCGAPNCRAGIKTALAQIGAQLFDAEGKSWKIKRSKLRDVESFGMLCSLKELEISNDHNGIFEYTGSALPGTDLSTLFSDPILEISLTPNLGHCLSVRGIARELAATYPCKINTPEISFEESKEPNDFQIQIDSLTECDRYCCRVVKGINPITTPEWIKQRLEIAGIRSINCAVDISNYVMLELGQPLHFFDLEKISGKKLIVSNETKKLSLMTLDEQMRPIPKDALLICDEEKPLAFAGVMGGLDTAVTESTGSILIEAAHFDSSAIRKSAKVLDLRSESSFRFERGTDVIALNEALDRAATLLQKICGASVCKGISEKSKGEIKKKLISLRSSRINQVLGTELSNGELEEILGRLDIHVVKVEHGSALAEVPSYRNDLEEEIDLVEEVARIYGYEHLPKRESRHPSSKIPHSPLYPFENEIRTRLIGFGLQEWITCDLISPLLSSLSLSHDEKIEPIAVLHPRSVDQSILRTTLFPGLLQSAKNNLDRQNQSISAFEVGRIHFKDQNKFLEMCASGILLTGDSTPYHWDPKPKPVDFYDLKGIVENLLHSLHIGSISFAPSHLPQFHPGRQARIFCRDIALGALGEVHPDVAKAIGIDQRIYYAELNLNDLLTLSNKVIRVAPFSNFPKSERDWTISLPLEIEIEKLFDAVRNVSSPYLEETKLLDIYTGEKVENGKKNITLRFSYRDTATTISQEVVDREHQKLVVEVAQKLAIV